MFCRLRLMFWRWKRMYNLFEFCKQYSNRPHSMFNCITSQNAWSDHSNYAQYVKSAFSFHAFLYENTKFVIVINTINITMKILRQVNKIKTKFVRNKKYFASGWEKRQKNPGNVDSSLKSTVKLPYVFLDLMIIKWFPIDPENVKFYGCVKICVLSWFYGCFTITNYDGEKHTHTHTPKHFQLNNFTFERFYVIEEGIHRPKGERINLLILARVKSHIIAF